MADVLITELPDAPDDAVLLDESSYGTDIDEFVRHLALQGVGGDEFKPRIVQWVADSPDPSIYRDRKWEAIRYLKTFERTFQRWVKNFDDRKKLRKSILKVSMTN